jgi:transcriptional regulator with XRE-family HTH domain
VKARKLTKFGRYLKKRNISTADAAAALDLTRSYIQMLKSGAATPGLKAAASISKWSKGAISFESWLS